jgi:hypothetical protein
MSPEGRAALSPLIPHLVGLRGEEFFAFVTDRTIAAVADLTARRA